MSSDESDTLQFASAEAMTELRRWLVHLGAERRMSPKTVEAYERDVRQFLGFLTGHGGELVTLSALAAIEPRDVRAFMASRRAGGIGSRSLMRSLAGARSFARFLERNGKGKVGALSAVRAPKVPKTLPKPIGIRAAKQLTETDLRAGEEREPWVLARARRTARRLCPCRCVREIARTTVRQPRLASATVRRCRPRAAPP